MDIWYQINKHGHIIIYSAVHSCSDFRLWQNELAEWTRARIADQNADQ